MKNLLLTLIIVVLSCSTIYAVDARVIFEAPDGFNTGIRINNLKMHQGENTVDKVNVIDSDGIETSIPLSALEIIFKRRNQYIFETKSGRQHAMPIDASNPLMFSGDHKFGGTMTFSSQYLKEIEFR